MRRWILLALLLLLVVTPRCDVLWSECSLDWQCDDGNPCTSDACDVRGSPNYDPDQSFCSDSGTRGDCEYSEVNDGAACDADGEPGTCRAGECQPSGKASEPILDGGVSDVGTFEVQP